MANQYANLCAKRELVQSHPVALISPRDLWQVSQEAVHARPRDLLQMDEWHVRIERGWVIQCEVGTRQTGRARRPHIIVRYAIQSSQLQFDDIQ